MKIFPQSNKMLRLLITPEKNYRSIKQVSTQNKSKSLFFKYFYLEVLAFYYLCIEN